MSDEVTGRIRKCPCCDYDLTGLDAVKCPECGCAIEPEFIQRGSRKPVLHILVLLWVGAMWWGLSSWILPALEKGTSPWPISTDPFVITAEVVAASAIVGAAISTTCRERIRHSTDDQYMMARAIPLVEALLWVAWLFALAAVR